jgi:biotin-dependent carboxylase-like uncharacterized protein
MARSAAGSSAGRRVQVLEVGAQVTVQDLGRPGLAHLGVPCSGALDGPAHRLANRLVGNDEDAATLECLDGRIAFTASCSLTVAVTGAQAPVTVAGRARDWGVGLPVPAGARIEVGAATSGLRAYVALTGGVAAEPVLGSRAADLLSGLGPEPVEAGDELALGEPGSEPVPVDTAAPARRTGVLRMRLGPREDWFEPACLETLDGSSYTVSSSSNRIGLRLEGEQIRWGRKEELPSEGMVLGAVQVPPNGQPVVFLNDHPTTGGYPVVGVVLSEDLPGCAQLRPGEQVTLRVVGPAPARDRRGRS